MYHIQIMEDVLSLCLLIDDPAARLEIQNSWTRMAEYLTWMRHPDGEIPLFNDAARNAVSHPSEMLGLGHELGWKQSPQPPVGGHFFPDSGMLVWHGSAWTIFWDIGEIGPGYQSGHAHADTLSLECSVRGRRLFVDPGNYHYDHDDIRRYDRSTAAHNTVCIDQENSSEVWHIFRAGRRAKPLNTRVEFRATGLDASASHDGYDHLPGSPRHKRQLCLDNAGTLGIRDRLSGSQPHAIEGGWLLDPCWSVRPQSCGWELHNGETTVRVTITGSEKLSLTTQKRPGHPEYGREIDSTRLVWQRDGMLPFEVITHVEVR